jgi:pimeloyl-ACP methyl ester carboxylesterase
MASLLTPFWPFIALSSLALGGPLAHAEIPSLNRVQTYDQVLDPTYPTDARTFKQRYWVSDQYATNIASPVIYYICGESSCFDDHASAARPPFPKMVAVLAKNLHAYVVVLEHRYFGKSQPFDQLTAENLKYLSIENAIEDLAHFQAAITAELGLQGKWVSLGGSYSGVLSAAYRLKHPERVVGAIASSAPVHFGLGSSALDEFTAESLGSDCRGRVQNFMKQIEADLNDPVKFTQAKDLLGLDSVTDPRDVLDLLASDTGYFVQYGLNDGFCRALAQKDPLHVYAQQGSRLAGLLGLQPIDIIPSGARSTDVSKYEGSIGMRQWYWLECTEVGGFITPSPKLENSVTPQSLNDYEHQNCAQIFGVSPTVNPAAMNQEYYEPLLSPTTSNIIFTNGSDDPIALDSISHALGNDTNPHTLEFLVQDGSHCSDLNLYASTAAGENSLQAELDLIYTSMISWLK